MKAKTSSCRGCGKPILWGVTSDGKKIPLDPRAPVYVVRVLECPGTDHQVIRLERSSLIDGMEVDGEPQVAYVSHFATCPKANDFSSSIRALGRV